jgi:hypothetical protein
VGAGNCLKLKSTISREIGCGHIIKLMRRRMMDITNSQIKTFSIQ